IRDILRLKNERANLLGYDKYAAFVLEERMAENPSRVMEFLSDLLEKSKPKGEEEVRELGEFARELEGIDQLQRWDFGYFSEKLKKKKFEVDDELLKPYFSLEKVVAGVFATAERLYGLEFIKDEQIPVYHPDVSAYEVKDKAGNHLAVFYADFFP